MIETTKIVSTLFIVTQFDQVYNSEMRDVKDELEVESI